MNQYTHAPASPAGSPLRKLSAALLAALVATLILGAMQANAQPIDLRSPDNQDTPAVTVTQGVDLRSPDARDAAGTQAVDLRSPDAVDAGQYRPGYAGRFRPAPVASSKDSSDDLNWGYLGIVFAGVGLVGGAVAMTLRRRHRATHAASA